MRAAATAETVIQELRAQASEGERDRVLRRMTDPATQVVGVRMGTVFAIARRHAGLPLDEVEQLLDSPLYEARMVAVSVLDLRARRRGIGDDERRELHDL